MDQQLQDLIDQLRQLVPTLQNLGQTRGTASPVRDTGVDRIVQALGRLNATMDQSVKTKDAERRSMESFVKEVDKAVDAQEEYRKKQNQAAAAIEQSAREQAEAARRAAMTDQEIAEERRQQATQALKQQYAELIDKRAASTKYAALIAKEQLEQHRASSTLGSRMQALAGDSVKAQTMLIRLSEAGQATNETLSKLGSAVGVAGRFVQELGEGNTKFTALNPLIDAVADSLGKMAEAIPFAGSAISGATKLVAEGTKFIIGQLQTTVDTFQELGQTGALTAEGMSGVQRQFLESGMSLAGFKKSVVENSATLARFGGTVGDGSKKFTKMVGSIVDSDAGDALRRLGFSADDIGDTAAAFVTQQTRLGLAQGKSQQQLAQGTEQYAKELDLLTKLTGMNRKDVQKQQDAALSEARFRAQYDDMVAQGREKEAKAMLDFQTMVSSAAPEMAAGFRDLSTGFVNSDAARKLFADTGGASVDIMERLKAGQIDQVQAFKELQAATKSQMGVSRDLAKATGDSAGIMSSYAQKSDLVNAKIVDGQVQLQKSQADQMKKGTDPLTDSAVDAQKSMEQMSRQIQNFGFAVMPKAAEAVNQFTGALNEFVKGVAKATGIDLPTISQNNQALSKSVFETKTSVDNAKKAMDIVNDPSTVVKEQEQRRALIDQQDKKNLEKATAVEKAQVGVAKTVEKVGDAIGDLVSWLGAKETGAAIKAAAGEARESRVASDTQYLKSQGRAPSGPATGTATQSDLAGLGLKIKQGDVQADGAQISPRLLEMATKIQSQVPGFNYFSGFNDRFHQENAPGSRHTSGMAADFTLTQKPTPEESEKIVGILKGLGASRVIDEYANPSAKATGGHFHVEVDKFARGGIASGPKQGFPAMLHGTEAVVPLPDGKTIPVDIKGFDMGKAMDAMMSKWADPSSIDQLRGKNRGASDINSSMAYLMDNYGRETKNLSQIVENIRGMTSNAVDSVDVDPVRIKENILTALADIRPRDIDTTGSAIDDQFVREMREVNRELPTAVARAVQAAMTESQRNQAEMAAAVKSLIPELQTQTQVMQRQTSVSERILQVAQN